MRRRPPRPETARPESARRRWTLFGACLSLITAIGLLATLGHADVPLHPSISEQDAKALNMVAQVLTAASDHTDQQLKELGYNHPGIPDEIWGGYPSVRKIEAAYLAAEAAEKGSFVEEAKEEEAKDAEAAEKSGGRRFLALMSKTMAQQYESAGKHPALRDFVEEAKDAKPVKFAILERPADSPLPTLHRTERDAVDALAHYCEGGEIGPRAALVDHFRLDVNQAYDIMRRSRSTAEMLTQGLQAVPEKDRPEAMRRLVGEAVRVYEGARDVKEFDPYREPRDLVGETLEEKSATREKAFQSQRDLSESQLLQHFDGLAREKSFPSQEDPDALASQRDLSERRLSQWLAEKVRDKSFPPQGDPDALAPSASSFNGDELRRPDLGGYRSHPDETPRASSLVPNELEKGRSNHTSEWREPLSPAVRSPEASESRWHGEGEGRSWLLAILWLLNHEQELERQERERDRQHDLGAPSPAPSPAPSSLEVIGAFFVCLWILSVLLGGAASKRSPTRNTPPEKPVDESRRPPDATAPPQ